jgi:hypothetical protein
MAMTSGTLVLEHRSTAVAADPSDRVQPHRGWVQ